MNFMSDNAAGAAPEILAALSHANSGVAASYGADEITARLTEKLAKLFEKDVAVFPVATGTAANSLALATLTPHYGAVLCHEGAHIYEDECGAPEFFSGGAKLITIAGAHGKLTPDGIVAALAHFQRGFVHHVQPAAISLTQATERGTSYTPAEVAAISRIAKKDGMSLHMDGARFANALAFLKCTPAEATWKSGVDALSFGVTKNGALAAEAVVFFDPKRAADFAYRRKRGGHLFSKMRFLSAQIEAMLDDGLWLKLAGHANAMAQRLSAGLAQLPGFALEHPVEANEVFIRLPSRAAMESIMAAGGKFYPWGPVGDRPLIRLVCSFATLEAEVDNFLAQAKRAA
ncbi:MAG: low specificity L-threonine aldolase [Alphaproteobacteria bacterium]|nr:low specificity L-threonine aldolase [Alphaproteobacteria bacterium]